jgi:hypothetical protein
MPNLRVPSLLPRYFRSLPDQRAPGGRYLVRFASTTIYRRRGEPCGTRNGPGTPASQTRALVPRLSPLGLRSRLKGAECEYLSLR